MPDLRHGHFGVPHREIWRRGGPSAFPARHDQPGHGRNPHGRAVHDREDRRLRCRRNRTGGPVGGRTGRARSGGCTATSGSAPAPMPMLPFCWRGRKARSRARPASASLPCRSTGTTAARNSYRIVRLKDKLGTRSMASGEIVFDGAVAYPLGDVGPGRNNGLKHMLDQVNLSRLSHGVRAAAMMRRCLNEALVAARGRTAFGGTVADKPLMRRQLLKLMVPTEQALSMALFTADKLERSEAGDEQAGGAGAAADPFAEIPHQPGQYRGRNRRHGGARRQRLHRDLRQRAAGARRPSRCAVGGHLQHQRDRHYRARRRQGWRPGGARRHSDRPAGQGGTGCPAS